MNHRPVTSSTPRRRLATLAALLVALVPGLLLATALPASAHAALVSSDPADASSVETLPDEVTLEFNESIADPAYVVVTAPDGVRVNSGDAAVAGPQVTQALDAQGLALPAGTYTLAYRVVSADGHPISGEQTFEVETPTVADADAADAAQTDETAEGAGNDDGGDALSTVLLVAGVVAVFGLGGALVLRARRGGSQ
ncbi:copper resistance protein CopC [Nocardioides ochotonae]|uniref:copper resistance protein CopC n=1 Tax=Nocardioides ochotonae TaxID=2685869 RepID=UPI00140DC130